MSKVEIKNVVFDVGRVLVDFSFDNFIKFLKEHGLSASTNIEFFQMVDLNAYEMGLISSEQFLNNILKTLKTNPEIDDIIYHWQNIFKPNEEMLSLLSNLKENYQVYLLSNTCELHWDHVEENYQLESRVHGTITSFRAGVMKPNPEIYYKLTQSFNAIPQETIFIDDLKENIEGAKAAGWHGIHHLDYSTTIQALKEKLVLC